MKTRLIAAVGLGAIALMAYLFWPNWYCSSAYKNYGFKVAVCPNGTPRQVVSIWGRNLQRGGDGQVEVAAAVFYTTAKADEIETESIAKFDVKLSIVDSLGTETALATQSKWRLDGQSRKAEIKLPQLDDGDYLLRARVRSKVEESIVDMKLALYAPAAIHVLTDRPLYEPGNMVQFRALALRARDLSPIDNRPGSWIVRDPSGEILLEEKAPAGEWGVVAGDFPLADNADHGNWSVAWRSGSDEQSTSFRVEPFVLPRFRVETSTHRPYYQGGDEPVVSGSVVYSSGAPVADAKLEIHWSASGDWPPPTEWFAGKALPAQAQTAANGRFELQLPKVPMDLRGQASLVAHISAIDPAGDRVASSITVPLREDAIEVSAVTELRGGLVENTNNRVYLRVTSSEGYPLGGAAINVKRAWAAGDKGIDAELDTDGVARIQFDPGRPVSVIIPPMPVRKSKQPEAGGVTLSALHDMVSTQQAGLADQVAAEAWLANLGQCSRWVQHGSQSASLSFRVSPSGSLSALTTSSQPLNQCLAKGLKSRRLASGTDRLYSASFSVQASDRPRLSAAVTSTMSIPSGLQELVNNAAADARQCLPKSFEGALPWPMFWQSEAKSPNLQLSWMKSTGSKVKMPKGLDACISSKLGKTLAVKASASSLGLIRYHLTQPHAAAARLAAQPTVLQGYELTVTARAGEKIIGSTKLFMQPGSVPNLRLRATPVIATPGDEVELAFFRGPEYRGDLPAEIMWTHRGDTESIELEDKAKAASFALPADAKGWYEFSAGGARALIFVRSQDDLSVSLTPEAETYAPGEMASIRVQTNLAGAGAKAAVGLFGVDDSLSQLTTLRGPDDLGSIRPAITMSEQAFGALDAQALTLGRIRGAHAAEATILRVEAIPAPADVDVVLFESAETRFDPIEELTDRFYIALAELHVQTRAWEATAKAGVTLSPSIMSGLWKKALTSCGTRGEKIEDAYGRSLRLHWLPSDLLALTDPANVVADATRLPEDVENWQAWVMREKP